MEKLRYQNIFEIENNKEKIKKREVLAPISEIQELVSILSLPNINQEQEKIISFDLYMLDVLNKYSDWLKKDNIPISFNLYPVTLLWLIDNKENKAKKYIKILKDINCKMNWNFSVEILENWLKEYSLVNTEKAKIYLDFLKSIWIVISVDDLIINWINWIINNNSHNLFSMLYILNEDNIKYLKFDISFTQYLVNNQEMLVFIFKMFNNKFNNNNKIIILEWIETQNMVNIFEKYKKQFNNIKLYYQGFYFHKPETLDFKTNSNINENKQ